MKYSNMIFCAVMSTLAITAMPAQSEALEFNFDLRGSSYELSCLATDMWGTHRVRGYEATLMRVTSDIESGFMEIRLVLSPEDEVTGFRVYSDAGLRSEFTVANLNSGIVLKKEGRHEVAKLVGRNVTGHAGGRIDFVYLANGVFGTKEIFPINLIRSGGHWGVYTNDQGGHREFRNMFLKGKKFAGKVIGIDKVIVN